MAYSRTAEVWWGKSHSFPLETDFVEERSHCCMLSDARQLHDWLYFHLKWPILKAEGGYRSDMSRCTALVFQSREP